MVESGNYHLENKTFILSVNYGTVPGFHLMGGIHKSKYSYYIAQPSMLCHNYIKFWQIRWPKLLHKTLRLRAMNAREVTQFHLVNIAC